MKYSIRNMNEWLYPDEELTERRLNPLRTVRGGSAGLCVLLSVPAGTRVTARFTSSGGAFSAELFRLLPVRVEHNTGAHGFTADWETAKEYSTREAPFDVFDAAMPLTGEGFTAGNRNEALYLSLRVLPEAAPGAYDGALTVTAGGEAREIPVSLSVADVLLPPESLKITNWFSVRNMAAAHGCEMWSEDHWKMIEKYGRKMRRMRQNVFWITWDLVDAEKTDAGGYHFDFSNIERLIRMYLGMGFTTIEGAPLYARESWDAAEFGINTPDGKVPSLSPEGYAYSAAFLTSWRSFLEARGWYDLLIQHVGDEPHGRAAAEYRILSGIIRKFLPGVPVIDAVETHELSGAVDIWVPKNDYYERNRDAMERLRGGGDTIWFYTCCIPGGHYANRLLDAPLLRARMLHWGNFRYDLPGYLHWGLNHWRDGDPFICTTPMNSPTNRLPAGDTHVVYPLGNDVLSSMRGEMMRLGAEDYELLRLLAESDDKLAERICGEVFRAFDDCDNTAEAFEGSRGKLIDALEKIN